MARAARKQTKRATKSTARRGKGTAAKGISALVSLARTETKQARAIRLLKATSGASITALMEATGWQQHSVRGFLAGVVRKKLQLNLTSTMHAGVRTYRIIGEPAKTPDKRPSSKVRS